MTIRQKKKSTVTVAIVGLALTVGTIVWAAGNQAGKIEKNCNEIAETKERIKDIDEKKLDKETYKLLFGELDKRFGRIEDHLVRIESKI
jgi:NADH dehydrogenase FAD-containing subunit